eukprot:COSAG04_NODE_7_length_45988_cov_220.188869_24_plen_356_part_00
MSLQLQAATELATKGLEDAVRQVMAAALLTRKADETKADFPPDPASRRALQSILADVLPQGKPLKESVDQALTHWKAIDAARRALAEEKQEDPDGWITTAALVRYCRGRSSEALAQGVSKGVHDWKEQKRREEEAKKEEQTIWETAGNETARVAGVRTPEEQAVLNVQLCAAAREGDAAAIERLAGEGASPDAKDRDGDPAVWLAAYEGHPAAVEALLRGGAAVDAVSSNGVTALMGAAHQGQAECARLLLEAGADAALRVTGGGWPFEGKTALELAEMYGKAEVAALLRQEPEPEPEVTLPPPPHLSAPLARPWPPTSRVAFFNFVLVFVVELAARRFARSRAAFRFKLSLVSH